MLLFISCLFRDIYASDSSAKTLQVSFVGMQAQEVAIKPNLRVVLKSDTEVLDEVVVTAMGIKRSEKALGYSATSVNSDKITATRNSDVMSALSGKIAGVQISSNSSDPGASNSVVVRGFSSLSGSNQPLYIIDGVPMSNSSAGSSTSDALDTSYDFGNGANAINPDDVESMTVLKGAAATALYGSRGLNGAVVITTKSGKGAKGFGISVSQTLGIDHAFKTPDIQTEFGPGIFAGWNDLDGNGTIWDPYQVKVSNGEKTYIGNSSYGYGPRYDGSQIRNYDGTWTTYSPHKNNMLDMYQLGFNTNTNVTVRGSGEKASFYASASYKKANSTTPNNTFERYSFLLKGTYQISDRVDIAGSMNFVNSKPRNAARNVGEYFVNPNIGMLGSHLDTKYFRDKYLGDHGGVASTSYGDQYGSLPSSYKNYWFAIDNYDSYRKETVIRPTLEVNVEIFNWLRFKADANMNYYYNRSEEKELGRGYANDGGYYGMAQKTKEEFTVGGTFTGNKQFGDFSLGGFTRFEYYNKSQSEWSVGTKGGMVVPGQWFVKNSKQTPSYSGEMKGTKRMMSAIFALNTSWKNQLYLDVTGRNDWSSALVYSNATGTHSYFYPSVSGSWLVSETFKEKMPSWISLAKLRVSWAQVGNDTDPYYINQTYNFGTLENPQGGSNVYTNELLDQIKSANLKPERKNSWEVGLDFRVLNDRLALDVTYYKENTKNQIMSVGIPSVSGASSQLINAGNIENKGVEIALNTIPFKNKDWQWDLNFTYTKNKSKIVELSDMLSSPYYTLMGSVNGGDYHVGSVAKVGGAYGLLMSDAVPAVNDKGEKLLTWDDSWRAASETPSGIVQEVGTLTPDFLGSISTTLTWKNLSLHIATDMRFGGMTASYANLYGTQGGWLESSLKGREGHGGLSWTSQYAESNGITYHDGVIPQGVFKEGTIATFVDGTKNDVSGMSYAQLIKEGKLEPTHAGAYNINHSAWNSPWGSTIDDVWFHEVNYISLREISLSYRFAKEIAHKVGAQGLSVMLSARNLGYLYNSLPNNINPESGRGNDSREFRIRGFEPYTANYMMTINVDF